MPAPIHCQPGPAATAALAGAIAQAKGGDLLAPVTVAVPSTYAGLSLRRTLGARPGGIVNVRFLSLARVAELIGAPALAAAGRRPLTPAIVGEAVRTELATEPGLFGPVATHPSTERRLTRAVVELRSCSAQGLQRMADSSRRAAEVVGLARRVHARLTAGWYDEHDLALAATEAVKAGGDLAALADVGALIAFGLRRVPPSMQRLLDALGDRVQVIEPALDGPLHPVDLVVSAPDPDEEIRTVVRLMMERVERDPSIPLHRMAILYPAEEPYARIAHQQLAAAGIPSNGPGGRRLAETLPGTALLGALALPDTGWRRDDVIGWLASAPILEVERGGPVPAGGWDTVSRKAGVVGGPAQWERRLAGHISRLVEERTADAEAEGGGRRVAHIEREIERAERLRLFVEALVLALDPGDRATWNDLAAWASGLLRRYLGPDVRHGHWPDADREAWQAVDGALRRLSGLDAFGGTCTLAAFRRALEQELDAPAGRIGAFGRGVLVAPLAMAAGAEFDTVFVVGVAEGALPGGGNEDALLPDSARRAVPGELAGRETRMVDDRAALVGGLAAGRERIVSWPRAELRRGRASLPSRWLPSGPSLEVLSFEDGLRQAGNGTQTVVPASLGDRDLADVLAWTAAGGPLDGHPIALDLPRLGRGWAVTAARASDTLTRFDGNVAGDGSAASTAFAPGAILSPTSLETYANCPMKYFLAQVLRLGSAERPEEILSISALDKGNLVHLALERYVRTLLDGQERSLSRLHALAEELFDELEAKGVAGKPLLWRYEREVMRRELRKYFESDDLEPLAAELAFGLDDERPVVLTLPDGRQIGFRGRADRVDSDGCGGLVVTDYKTGRGHGYKRIGADPVDRGRRLQLPLYGLAARQRFGSDKPVRARYVMVSERAEDSEYAIDVDDAVMARFTEVIDVIAGGISAGGFVTRPGEPYWQGGWEHCAFCEFDRLCPAGRDVHWDRKKRATPGLTAYVTMTEGEEASA